MIARNVQLDIPPKVADRIAELGLEDEINQVLEYTRSVVETLSEIQLTFYDDPSELEGRRLKFIAIKEGPYVRRDPERHNWQRGVLEKVSVQFLRWVRFELYPREMLDGRQAIS